MEVKLDKRYPLAVDGDRAWLVLRDIRAVAGCMPGAEITEQLDANRYKGTVKVKVGPANASFGGEVALLEIDEAAHRIHLNAKGAERGGSTASMDLTASIEAVNGAQSVLLGSSAVIVNGKFAQFGGRMMSQVSDMILAQFAANFAAAAAALPAPTPGSSSSSQAAPAPRKAGQLNALAIVWALIKSWFAGIFGKHT